MGNVFVSYAKLVVSYTFRNPHVVIVFNFERNGDCSGIWILELLQTLFISCAVLDHQTFQGALETLRLGQASRRSSGGGGARC